MEQLNKNEQNDNKFASVTAIWEIYVIHLKMIKVVRSKLLLYRCLIQICYLKLLID